MPWQLLIGLSVALYSVNGLLHRSIMKDESSDAHAQAIAFTALSSVFFWSIFLFRGGPRASPSLNHWEMFLTTSLLSSLGMVFVFKGFKSIGASEHTILLTSTQLWGILGAVLFLRETLSLTKAIGAAAILSGVMVAEWKEEGFVFNKGAVYVLLAALFFGTSGTIGYIIVRDFDVLAYMAYSSVIVTSMLLAARPGAARKLTFYFTPRKALNVVITSFNDALADIFGLSAYQVGRNALQIGPIGATGTFVTVLLAMVILKEKDRLPQKIAGSLAAVAGTILLL
jgi:drug/metabolite transporter (DMT)-like permease